MGVCCAQTTKGDKADKKPMKRPGGVKKPIGNSDRD